MRVLIQRCGAPISVAVLVAALPLALNAQDRDSQEPARPDDRATAAALAEVKSYRFFDGDGTPADFQLTPKPLLRYNNPVTGITNGFVFAWTGDDRPQAIAALYQNPGQGVSTEMHSLTGERIGAVRDDGDRWSPDKPGVTFAAFADAPRPGRSAGVRRIQLRRLAKRFSVERIDPDGERHQLRLLSAPLLTYGREPADVLAGAMFAFVQATNPDTLLLLEARRHGGEHRWEYALARLHHREMRATLSGAPVWTVGQLSNAQKGDRRGVYTIFRRRSSD